jgi:hypothetical protein
LSEYNVRVIPIIDGLDGITASEGRGRTVTGPTVEGAVAEAGREAKKMLNRRPRPISIHMRMEVPAARR